MSYLHGIEIKEGTQKAVLTAGDTSVVALVGTAPKGAVGEVKLITSADAARTEYGEDITGFTIPAALEEIFSRVAAKVLVVNILSGEKAASLLEEDGTMTRTEGGDPVTGIYKATLPSVADYAADLVGGLDKLLSVDDTLGVKPNIILVPGYSQIEAVMGKMIAVADKLEGFAVIDIAAADVQAALTARSSGVFNITSEAAVLCYPQVKRRNNHENKPDVCGLSVFWAVAKAIRDAESGYWLSPSNSEIDGIIGLTTPVTSSLTDPAADTNLLNGQGIVTVFRKSGMGTRIWGNWTAGFPSKTSARYMIAPRAVRMACREALVNASLTYMDKSVTALTVDLITGDVNAFLRGLVGSGALADGLCYYDQTRNTAAQAALGKMVFGFRLELVPSLETITFEEEIEY